MKININVQNFLTTIFQKFDMKQKFLSFMMIINVFQL